MSKQPGPHFAARSLDRDSVLDDHVQSSLERLDMASRRVYVPQNPDIASNLYMAFRRQRLLRASRIPSQQNKLKLSKYFSSIQHLSLILSANAMPNQIVWKAYSA